MTKNGFSFFTNIPNLITFDLEGTGGQDKKSEEIIDISFVKINSNLSLEEIFSTTLNPGKQIKRFSWIRHNISDEELNASPSIKKFENKIRELVQGNILLAHNARVDWNLLNRKIPDINPFAIIDTLKISKNFFAHEKSHTLQSIIQRFEFDNKLKEITELQPHRATYDAYATALFFISFINHVDNKITLNEIIEKYGLKIKPEPTQISFLD